MLLIMTDEISTGGILAHFFFVGWWGVVSRDIFLVSNYVEGWWAVGCCVAAGVTQSRRIMDMKLGVLTHFNVSPSCLLVLESQPFIYPVGRLFKSLWFGFDCSASCVYLFCLCIGLWLSSFFPLDILIF